MARTVIHKVEGNKSYARCKGRPGHRWDDHPNYQRAMHDWATARMVFRCSECGRIKSIERDSNGDWFTYYYDKPADYDNVVMERKDAASYRNQWSELYYDAVFNPNKLNTKYEVDNEGVIRLRNRKRKTS